MEFPWGFCPRTPQAGLQEGVPGGERGGLPSEPEAHLSTLEKCWAERGAPTYLRTDNGSEFIANALLSWCTEMGVTMYFIEPGSPWQNGRCESFNSRLRDERLNGELFSSIASRSLPNRVQPVPSP